MRGWLRVGCATVLLAWAGWAVPAARQQALPASAQTGAISGVVTDGVSGPPVADALVTLTFRRPGAVNPSRLTQVTDALGRFVFPELEAGDAYQLTASKFGFVEGAYGRENAESRTSVSVSLSTGQWRANLKIPVWRYGSISGHVTDERGEPLVGVLVRALLRVHAAGLNHLASGPLASTDDRGRYRIPGLPPGSYFVYLPNVQMSVPSTTTAATMGQRPLLDYSLVHPASRSPGPAIVPTIELTDTTRVVVVGYPLPPRSPDGKLLAYPLTFTGGATSLDQAQPIEVAAGASREGHDIRLIPALASIVRGVVEGPPEEKANLTVRLLAPGLDDLGMGSEVATALTAADGTFAFGGVPAGAYTIDAANSIGEYSVNTSIRGQEVRLPRLPGLFLETGTIRSRPAPPRTIVSAMGARSGFAARVPVVVGHAAAPPVTVRLELSPTIRGEIRLELDADHPFTPEVMRYITLDEATGRARLMDALQIAKEPDEFAFSVQPGAYLLRSTSATLMIKSLTCGGRDCTDQPVDVSGGGDISNIVVTVTNAAPNVTGTVTDKNGAATAGAIIAFPTDQEQWTHYGSAPARIRSVPANASGSYQLTLPAGDYFVVAVPSARSDAWIDPEFLRRAASQAERVSLGWGEARSRDLVLNEIR